MLSDNCILLSSDSESELVEERILSPQVRSTEAEVAPPKKRHQPNKQISSHLPSRPDSSDVLGDCSDLHRHVTDKISKSAVVKPKTNSFKKTNQPTNLIGLDLSYRELTHLDLTNMTASQFKKQRENLAKILFKDINARALGNILPSGMEIRWAKTLNKTAGQFRGTKDRHGVYSGYISLATKIIDTYHKLFNTLAHEMCHAADFLETKSLKLGHGPSWKAWTVKVCQVYPNIKITTRHSYDIFYKHWYRCIDKSCGVM
ncbi:hypothetical protein DSO57_1038698 [Entomophthora muscae]|uniref:Uncharacterized protein n=1 Tax=Entomophthora muscae TaxID=34485 RepID=A0ACC2U8A2_9FUNG|nr:hypothetical protein DSO57_1038698 [Entomophthora muscae]